MELGKSDPQKFWNTIGKINKWGEEKCDPTEKIPPYTWKKHFEKLLNSEDNRHTICYNPQRYNTFEPILDGIITKKEMNDALRGMKGNKSPGPDGILTEYLKVFGDIAGSTLLKLIRKIFASNIYPSAWTMNFLKPIYKKDDKNDPNNYRGLAIGSSFAKLYSMILLKRLNKYILANNYISPNQIGFKEGSRTSDHIFLLQTIIEKVVKKNRKRLYCVFVDFKKAYDLVDRKLLFQKLQTLGINGIFLKNIVAYVYKHLIFN